MLVGRQLEFGVYYYSGVAIATLERIIRHLESGIIPIVPSQGSVGASGDLAPLAHLFLPLIGLGQVVSGGKEMPAAEALEEAGLEPLELGPKEGAAKTQYLLIPSLGLDFA